MFDVKSLVRSDLQDFPGYSAARPTEVVDKTLLDANENPYELTPYHRYRAQQPKTLRDILSELYGVLDTQILMTRGSDEAIDVLVRTFCLPRHDRILICPPTYGMYAVSARLHAIACDTVPLTPDNFQLDEAAIKAALKPEHKLIFLCSPNNPTGNRLSKQAILDLCTARENQSLIVVDEAYIEFCPDKSLIHDLPNHPNLVLLRTLSKAYGLAGIRCGCLLTHADTVSWLRKILAPYPLSGAMVDEVTAILSENRERFTQAIAKLTQGRDALIAALLKSPAVIEVYPSEANFVLVRFKSANAIFEALRAEHIIVRSVQHFLGLQDCLRISIGTETEQARLLEVISHAAE